MTKQQCLSWRGERVWREAAKGLDLERIGRARRGGREGDGGGRLRWVVSYSLDNCT